MDPNENLREQLELAAEILKMDEGEKFCLSQAECSERAERLAELVLALDNWLRRKGFLPKAWLVGDDYPKGGAR